MRLVLKRVPAGRVLDTVSFSAAGVGYETGAARSIVDARLAAGLTPAQAWNALRGWSNGYLAFGDPVAPERVASLHQIGVRASSKPERWVQAHLAGLHPQDRHGRRFKVPGDPSSGLRKSQRELRESARQAEAAQELDDLRLSLAKARQRSDAFAKAAAEGSTPEGKPTAAPTRMTSGQYTKILKDEHVRLQLLDGKSEKEAKAAARPKATIDELKSRNTALRKALRAKGVDHRTEEQRRADDVEKNTLLDEVEQLATAGGHDGAAKRAAAAKMSRTELRKFVGDVKDYQRRQKAKMDAGSGDAFQAAEAASRAAPRQVGYIKGLLRQLAKSGGSVSGPTETAEIRKMSKRDASAYIKRLEGATT